MKNTQTNLKKNLSDISVSRETEINKPQVKIAKKITEISIIRKIGTEFIGAFLGVLIALFVSNWRESYKQNEFIGSVVQNIYLDNHANNEYVKTQIEHLKMQQDTVKVYLKDDHLTITNLTRKNEGLQIKVMNFTGWNVLGRSKLISQIDYELISALTSNSEQYVFFVKNLDFMIGLLNEKCNSTQTEDKLRFSRGISELMYSSEMMVIETAKIDSLLKAKYPKLIADLIK